MTVVKLPTPADPRITSVLIELSKKIRSLVGIRLAEIGLMTGEDEVLAAMRDGRPRTVSYLSTTLFVRLPTMRKCVDALVNKDLLERLAGPVVKITEKGASFVREIDLMHARLSRDISRTAGEEHVKKLLPDLETLSSSISAIIKPAA